MLLIWLGKLHGHGHRKAWSKNETAALSSYLLRCNSTLPFEIHRRIRSFDHIHYWKGTEFRTFLLYLGIVVLKNHLDQNEYQMFLDFYCAVTICSSNFYTAYLPLARKLFIDVINAHIANFGEDSITMNIHNLSHVVDDVENFGPLNTISAYEFENSLHHIKLRLKQCNKPLEQIVRRISELSRASASKPISILLQSNDEFPHLKHQCISHDHPDVLAFRLVNYKPNAMLSSVDDVEKNKWFLTFDNAIVEFHFITKDVTQKKHLIWRWPLKNTENFFDKPIRSSYVNVFLSDRERREPRFFHMNSIKAKMFCLPYENKWVFIPLLHTL